VEGLLAVPIGLGLPVRQVEGALPGDILEALGLPVQLDQVVELVVVEQVLSVRNLVVVALVVASVDMLEELDLDGAVQLVLLAEIERLAPVVESLEHGSLAQVIPENLLCARHLQSLVDVTLEGMRSS